MERVNKKRKSDDDKDFVKDGLSSDDIRKTVSTIRQYIEKPGSASLQERVDYLKEIHVKFAERYPMLFDICSRQTFDYDNLNYFLEMREKIINNTMTVDKASEQVGKEWFDKYVDVSKIEKK